MPEHPGFDLRQVDDRSIVRLRVRPNDASAAVKALQLPQKALELQRGDPMVCWLGPDQWLLASDTKPVAEIFAHIDGALSGQLFAAANISSAYACFAISGPASRILLAMGCGVDMHASVLKAGSCVRTRFAQVPLIIVATGDFDFDLYIDRSYANYLQDWLSAAGSDPIIRESGFGASEVAAMTELPDPIY